MPITPRRYWVLAPDLPEYRNYVREHRRALNASHGDFVSLTPANIAEHLAGMHLTANDTICYASVHPDAYARNDHDGAQVLRSMIIKIRACQRRGNVGDRFLEPLANSQVDRTPPDSFTDVEEDDDEDPGTDASDPPRFWVIAPDRNAYNVFVSSTMSVCGANRRDFTWISPGAYRDLSGMALTDRDRIMFAPVPPSEYIGGGQYGQAVVRQMIACVRGAQRRGSTDNLTPMSYSNRDWSHYVVTSEGLQVETEQEVVEDEVEIPQRRIYVLAGTHAQYIQWTRDHRTNHRTENVDYHYTEVTASVLRRASITSDDLVERIGTWATRSDITAVQNELLLAYRRGGRTINDSVPTPATIGTTSFNLPPGTLLDGYRNAVANFGSNASTVSMAEFEQVQSELAVARQALDLIARNVGATADNRARATHALARMDGHTVMWYTTNSPEDQFLVSRSGDVMRWDGNHFQPVPTMRGVITTRDSLTHVTRS